MEPDRTEADIVLTAQLLKPLIAWLWLSGRRGRTTGTPGRATSGLPFYAVVDGEYGFASQLVRRDGKVEPAKSADLEAKTKVKVALDSGAIPPPMPVGKPPTAFGRPADH